MNITQVTELENFDKIWHLKQARLMEGLSTTDLRAVAKICTDRLYSKEEVIFGRGEPATHIHILFRGCVRNSVGNRLGRERIVAFYKSGDVFGEELMGEKRAHHSMAIAHEECWVGKIARKDLLNLLRQRPVLSINLIRILSHKLGRAQDDIKNQSFMGTQERLARSLLRLGQIHGKELPTHARFRKLRIPLSHEHLARFIGANRPHVSTIMSEFKKKGWIDYQGRKLLINTDKLEAVADRRGRGAAA